MERECIIVPIIAAIILVWFLQSILTGFFTVRFDTVRHVTRVLPAGPVTPGSRVSVTLNVGIIPGDRFYLIEEIIPRGWTIIDSGDLVDAGKINASEAGHLKKAVISGADDTSYTYILEAPVSAGTYTFSGIFRIENMISEENIRGDNTIAVEVSTEICNGIDDNFNMVVDEGCDDDDDDYCDAGMVRDSLYSCTGTIQCCLSGGNDCVDTPSIGYYINPGSNQYCDCNPSTGRGATRGIAEICGNGIDEDCDGSDRICCLITDADWNESQIYDGQAVTLSVRGSDCADGDIIELELWETDGATSEIVSDIDLGTMAMSGGSASKEWDVVWKRDTGDATSDPEYFFKAMLQSNTSIFNVSDVLRVTTDDEDNDGVHDNIDCNDNNPNIGQCRGCAVCSDPSGIAGTCIDGKICPDIKCTGLCGYGRCNLTSIPAFKFPTENSTCVIVRDIGVCTIRCQDYNCRYAGGCEADDDGDGVPNLNDRCPNTAPEDVGIVNIFGCPRPIATKFTPDLTTDFNRTDLLNITNMTLGITNIGQIKFIGKTRLLSYIALTARRLNLDSYVDIQRGRVNVDSRVLTMLNKKAIIRLFNLTIQRPVIKKDGRVCLNCIILRPEEYSGSPGNPDNITFLVPNFTEYTVEESVCGDDYCYESHENCSACPADCGDCPCTDTDGDGYNGTGSCSPATPGYDCDETDTEVNPGMTEISYNGRDDDCNSLTRDYDLDGDMNNATAYGGTDCNDNNPDIGQCTGCAVCSDSSGMSGVCEADDSYCEPIECPTSPVCAYGSCNSTSIAVFDHPAEETACSLTGDNGVCEPNECQNYHCEYVGDCEADDDGDGVPNLNDRCPNTAPEDVGIVNIFGCPRPIATKFTPDLTTDFNRTDLLNITNMTLGITNIGQIKFIGKTTPILFSAIDSRYTPMDFDSNVDMTHNLVDIDSAALNMLNKPAIIRLFNLAWTKPIILKNGDICSDCEIMQYMGQTNITFYVKGFSNYSTGEHFCGDGSCDSDVDESCSNCETDCGVCSRQPPGGDGEQPSVTPGPSLSCGDQPVQPCASAVWEDYPICAWNTSQCEEDTRVCTVGEKRCLGNYLQRCEERSDALWYTLEVCYHGCNISSLSCNPGSVVCEERWTCSAWSTCADGVQTRLCYDSNKCNTFNEKPLEVRNCEAGPSWLKELDFETLTRIAIIVITGILIVLIVFFRKSMHNDSELLLKET